MSDVFTFLLLKKVAFLKRCNCRCRCFLGYDPSLVNPYLPKVLENLGALVYEELENEGQIYFNITSVVSSHGEQLMLKQVNVVGNWFLYLLCFGFFVSIFSLTFRL